MLDEIRKNQRKEEKHKKSCLFILPLPYAMLLSLSFKMGTIHKKAVVTYISLCNRLPRAILKASNDEFIDRVVVVVVGTMKSEVKKFIIAKVA